MMLLPLIVISLLFGREEYYCYQRPVEVKQGKTVFHDPICYRSNVEISGRRDHITIDSDSVHLSLIRLHNVMRIRDDRRLKHYRYLAVESGHPERVYSIDFREADGIFIFSVAPTALTSITGLKDRTGVIFAYSNSPIKCQ